MDDSIETCKDNAKWTLSSAICTAEVRSLGGMLQNVHFLFANGDTFAPLAQADWADDAPKEDCKIAPHLQRLGGEWPCVPFGTSPSDPQHHGYASNAHWRCTHQSQRRIELVIDFPKSHVVSQLRRTIEVSEEAHRVDCSLSIIVRNACELPIGLHPIFRLPTDAPVHIGLENSTLLEPMPAEIRTPNFQLVAAEGRMLFGADGQEIDFSQGYTGLSTELVQGYDAGGKVAVEYPQEGKKAVLQWDENALPHCLFWLANPHQFEHLGAFRGLGVEPISSWFDRGTKPLFGAAKDSPRPFGVKLKPSEPWSMDYSISAETILVEGG
ncbi:hypothetical protein AB9F29_07605 [Falsihalocynthiibacter sp. S25ZX9]|uniref:hypothetical protein n=1 Tax=Falsihalocynthiibacter sp. S25ZX9 TaxID=3240870 RepID=UPI00350F4C0F